MIYKFYFCLKNYTFNHLDMVFFNIIRTLKYKSYANKSYLYKAGFSEVCLAELVWI